MIAENNSCCFLAGQAAALLVEGPIGSLFGRQKKQGIKGSDGHEIGKSWWPSVSLANPLEILSPFIHPHPIIDFKKFWRLGASRSKHVPGVEARQIKLKSR
jgi:hypothetical protein